MSDRVTLGIDLGTTYSCVAHLDEYGKPVALLNSDGKTTTPSVVYFEDEQTIVVGDQAKNELARNPDHVISEIKRHMGEEGFFRTIGDRDFYPAQVSSYILQSLVEDALDDLGVEPPADGPIADVVITVPAYFGGAEREATKEAGQNAGLNVVSIINEPTAAAIAYGLNTQDEARTVLVYDLGGGTFDVTVIQVSQDEIRAVATGGDRQLGGIDWDRRLVDLFLQRFREQQPDAGDPEDDKEALGELELKAEGAKHSLTKKATYGMSFVANRQRVQFDLAREQFEQLTEDLVSRTLDYTELVLDAAAEKGVNSIDEVILVGGMSRVPVIAERLGERLLRRFPDLPEPRLQDPDQIVAKGAALFAVSRIAEVDEVESSARQDEGGGTVGSGFLPGPRPGAGPKIVNITSRAYGIRAVRDERDEVGYISFIIQQNDELPVDKHETYRTVSDNQTEVNIEVYEQDTEVPQEAVSANKLAIEGILPNLPTGKPAGQPIDVTFRLGDEGILEILAESGGKQLTLEYTLPGQTPAEELAKPRPVLAKG
ncbi:Hsp70 family protein [Kineococcus sp. SYSU DK005]|uniref:Hsp70 family protein n=1 Tax=Kineococcus sp. SYSU DK005 TaxID=3383126 RepID=UPI003D7DC68F